MTNIAKIPAPLPLPRRKLITAQSAAERCGVPLSTLYDMVREDRIGGVVRFGRAIRFDPDALETWIAEGGQALSGGWRRDER